MINGNNFLGEKKQILYFLIVFCILFNWFSVAYSATQVYPADDEACTYTPGGVAVGSPLISCYGSQIECLEAFSGYPTWSYYGTSKDSCNNAVYIYVIWGGDWKRGG